MLRHAIILFQLAVTGVDGDAQDMDYKLQDDKFEEDKNSVGAVIQHNIRVRKVELDRHGETLHHGCSLTLRDVEHVVAGTD